MSFNLAFFPTLGLAAILFVFGTASARGGKGSLLLVPGMGFAALPALLYAFFYTHRLDNAAWFYEVRSWPGAELAAAGAGWTAGRIHGSILRRRWIGSSRLLRGVSTGAVFFLLGLLLFVPYAKSVLLPLVPPTIDRWSNGVCIQGTPSTCGPSSAATLLRRHHLPASERELAGECYTYGGGTENWYLARALRRRGLKVDYQILPPDPLDLPYPSIAGTLLGGAGHFIAILCKTGDRYVIGDPLIGRTVRSREELRRRYTFTGFFLVERSGTTS